MMGLTTLHTLFWLLAACTLTKQDLVKVHVTPKITAECGKQVTLNCKVSSLKGLQVKHMGWSQDKLLCSMDSAGDITTHNRNNTLSHFHCEYNNGQLSLIFQEVQPLETGQPYKCKLHSNKGASHGSTRVELQEFCGLAEGVVTSDGPSCTFSHVYPGGDVHWFHGSRNLSDGSTMQRTTKRVEKGGYQTIHSQLEWNGPDEPFNCSLKSAESGRYIASALVQNPKSLVRSGAGSLGVLRTIWGISVLIVLSLT